MQVSYSRVSTFHKCPYQFKLRYVDKLETYPNVEDPQNALYLGSALHLGIEKNTREALNYYYNQYPIINDFHVCEAIKLEYRLKQCKEILPEGLHETKIEVPNDFIGFIDLLVPIDENTYDLYDFKYSNNVKSYLESEQLHIYKFYFEKLNPTKHIRNLYFLFVPKVNIRPKKKPREETIEEFRKRIVTELEKDKPQIVQVDYDIEKVKSFLRKTKECRQATTFPKVPTRLCDWCNYQNYCEKGETLEIMNLPKNERVASNATTKRKLWIYGAPFSGKTHLANEFPELLLLSTDGNYRHLNGGIPPHIDIVDQVTVEGRLTKRKLAWEILKETISELEKKQNDFKTICLDLVEDSYEHCRLYMYDKLGITHEGDDPYKAWDKVRTEFLSTIKRFFALDYENLIIISHEDTSKDVTRKSGDKITSIKPNLQDKPALKLSGMVDIVMRTIAEDDKYTIEFKKSEVIFGGGRLSMNVNVISNSFDELIKVYDEADKSGEVVAKEKPKPKKQKKEVKQEVIEPIENDDIKVDEDQVETATIEPKEMEVAAKPKPRTRKSREVVEEAKQEVVAKVDDGIERPWEDEEQKVEEVVVEEQPRRRRRRGQ